MKPPTPEQAEMIVAWCRRVANGEQRPVLPLSDRYEFAETADGFGQIIAPPSIDPTEVQADVERGLAERQHLWGDRRGDVEQFCYAPWPAFNWWFLLIAVHNTLGPPLNSFQDEWYFKGLKADSPTAERVLTACDENARRFCGQLVEAWERSPETFLLVLEVAAAAFDLRESVDMHRRLFQAREYASGVTSTRASKHGVEKKKSMMAPVHAELRSAVANEHARFPKLSWTAACGRIAKRMKTSSKTVQRASKPIQW
jgi:hypothetical protein